jgi:hypothetical protein
MTNVFVSAQSVLATHSMLSAIDTNTTDVIRTTNYVGKDIIGQLGGLIYMSKIGNDVDKDSKKFLKYSNIRQQLSFVTTGITPLVSSSYFLPIAGMSNILANISFIGFGSINAKCIQKISIDDNLGEIYAKISIVNTLGSSVGMLLGLGITSVFLDHETRFIFLPILGICRIYCYNKAIEGIL